MIAILLLLAAAGGYAARAKGLVRHPGAAASGGGSPGMAPAGDDPLGAQSSAAPASASLQWVIQSLPGAVAVLDSQMRYLALSQGWRETYGLGDRELLGLSHYQVFPEIPPRWRQVHQRALAGESLRADEDRFERQDGSEQWLRWQVVPWHEPGGAIGGILIVTEDISARVRERTVAQLDQERYRRFLDEASDAIFVHDVSGRFIEVNQRACDSVGYTRAQLLTMNVLDLEQDFDLARAQAAWSLIEPGSVTTLRGHHRRQDGSRFPVEVRFGVLEVQGQRLYLGAVRDISARERADSAIREAALRLRDALEAAQAGIWEWDTTTDRVYWSDEVYALFGLDAHSTAPSYDAWLASVHPADRAQVQMRLQSAVQQGAELALEWRVQAAEPGPRWLLSRGKPNIDAAHKTARYRGIVVDITGRKLAEEALRDSERRYRTVFQTCPDAITINRREDGLYVDINEGYTRIFGWAAEEVIGRTSLELGIWREPADRAVFVEQVLAAGLCRNFEASFCTKDGRQIAALVSSRLITVQGEEHFLTVTHDITERKAAEAQLRKLSQAVEQSPESIVILNLGGQIEYANQAFSRTSGFAKDEILGRTPGFLAADPARAPGAPGIWATLHRGETWSGEFHNRRKDGAEYTEYAIVAPLRQGDGRVSHYVAVQQDITERLRAQRQIQQLAYYDQLTGLPNRALLADRLKQATSACARLGAHGALMMIDLDDFKLLNDTFGHDMGDQLLKQVAERMRACVRRGDTLARLGGDEFMLVMAGLSADAQEAALYAQAVARKVLTALHGEFSLDAGLHRCTASIGIALFNSDQLPNDEMMKQADLAMYQAKSAGRDGLRFFDPQMEASVKRRAALEQDLRRGLQERQFLLHYQPQVDDRGRLLGVEALVRWQHPVKGLVAPAEFIPVAEACGLIVPLGREIFAMALAQMVQWSALPELAALDMAVNVSARQIRQADFVDQVMAAVHAAGAPADRLKLEITESLLIEDTEAIIETMQALKARGVGFILDDFGIGYSSLSYLKRLPLDQMKIDQSFVRDVLTDANDAAIARTIIALADSLGLGVIAEGVETLAQRDFLAAAGCRAFQGYYFSRPLTAGALQAFVLERSAGAGDGAERTAG